MTTIPITLRTYTDACKAFNFMVVMITPVAFSSIKYQTYIIFAVMYVPSPFFPISIPVP